MIIHGLNAENFLKYRHLDLDDLPEQGVIAISGHNESGKSTIGETLCFALFGRTFAVAGDVPDKLIRWGENRCSVRVEFSRNGQRYEITRMLDRDGNHSARLSRVGETENPLARGAEAVAEAMFDMTGFEFEEFIESFYLAQREITTPHPHSYAVKVMAGVAPLEFSRNEFQEEVQGERNAIEAAEGKAADVEVQLQGLGFDPVQLQGLESQRGDLEQQAGWIGERREALNVAGTEYLEREPRLRALERSRRVASLSSGLFFVLAAALLALWGWLFHGPQGELAEQVRTAISAIPDPDWLLYAGIVLAVIFVLFWIRVAALRGRIRELRGSGGRLANELGVLGELEGALPAELTAAPAQGAGGETDGEVRAEPETRDHLRPRIESGAAGKEEVQRLLERETAWLDRASARARTGMAEADREIAREKERQAEHNKLAGMREAFQEQVEGHRGRIRVRELADELLQGAIRHLSHRFNHNLRGLVGGTLPMFTEGRYEHLQIDEDLKVRTFSSEKRDFMDLDEISSGTQRQIMLALRLALSQELINRVVKGGQFLFLDEPFAFFDDSRTRSSLEVLPRLSDELTQIWIVAQQFPADVVFDRRVECARENESLTIG